MSTYTQIPFQIIFTVKTFNHSVVVVDFFINQRVSPGAIQIKPRNRGFMHNSQLLICITNELG